MRPRGIVAASGAVALLPFVAACYTYVPLLTPAPAPGTKVSLVLSDQGRYEAAPQVGPYAVRVEGAVVQSTESDYILQVTDVVDIRGARNKWAGETVPLRRSYVVTGYERRFSRGRTAFLVAGLASAFLAAVVGYDLLGFATSNEPGPGEPPVDQ
ncbi:MAG TPA: hypothetical protein VGQ06_12755 [Gemmatimonadales bacterium]|jgi:hypothetical protein|nr:hypothetical protein [Gemmatimonadales bacterium]